MSEIRRPMVLVCVALLGAVLLGVGTPASGAAGENSAVERYFEGLRQRRLFAVAEGFALSRLAASTLLPGERIELAVQLARTYAAHAQTLSGAEQAEYWDRARSVLTDAAEAVGDDPRDVQIAAERAFVEVEQGEFLARMTAFAPHDRGRRRRADAQLDAAAAALRSVNESLGQPAEPRDGWGAWERARLRERVRLRLVDVLQSAATLSEPRERRRREALAEAEAWLVPLTEDPGGGPTALRARVRLAANHRLRGDLRRATEELQTLAAEAPPRDIADAALAERVRVLLDDGRAPDAAELLLEYRRRFPLQSGELLFLTVRTLAALREVAMDKGTAADVRQLTEQIRQTVERGERAIGGYWVARGRQLLTEIEQAEHYGPELAALVRRAKSRYATGDLDEAAADFASASESARQTDRPDEAFDLGYTGASILVRQGKFADAAEALRKLVEHFPDHARTPEAHLLLAISLGRLYQQEPNAGRRDAYSAALERHVAEYPDHATAGEVHWLRAALAESRAQITQALEHYRRVPADHQRGAAARAGVARSYDKVLRQFMELEQRADDADRRRAIRERAAEWRAAAQRDLSAITATFPDDAARLSAAQGEVLLRLARVLLEADTPDYARADALLEKLLAAADMHSADDANDADDADGAEGWRTLARAAAPLRVVSLAGQGQAADAAAVIDGMAERPPSDLLALIDALGEIVPPAGGAADLARLRLRAAHVLEGRRNDLPADERLAVDRALARAYLDLGDPDRAAAVYERLLKAAPKDTTVLAEAAKALQGTGRTRQVAAAKELWGRLEAASKQGSDAWLEARLRLAECALALGRTDECRKLLGVTLALYPDAGGPERKARFEALRTRLKSAMR